MTSFSILTPLLAVLAATLAAPLLGGGVNQCRAWLQNRGCPFVRNQPPGHER